MRTFLQLAIAATVMGSGCPYFAADREPARLTDTAVPALEDEPVTDPKSGLTLRLPKGWLPKKGIEHTGFEAPSKDRDDVGGVAPNIVLSKDPAPGVKPADLVDILAKKSKQYATVFGHFEEVLIEPRTVGQDEGRLIRAKYKVKDVLAIEMEQLWVIKDGQVYIVTLTSLGAAWEENLPTFEAVLKAVQVP